MFKLCFTLLALAVSGETASPKLFERLDRDADGAITPAEIPAEQQRLFARLVRSADANGDGSLSATEFAQGIAPQRPEKLVETNVRREPVADAARVLLLKLDTSRDCRITAAEVPAPLKSAFERLAEQVDTNKNDVLDRFELGRIGPQMGRVALRVAVQQGWNVSQELAKLRKQQGKDAERFDQPLDPQELMNNPERATELFALLDSDADGKVETEEFPEQFPTPLRQLLMRTDANRDGAISLAEFRTANERLGRLRQRMRMRGGSSPN